MKFQVYFYLLTITLFLSCSKGVPLIFTSESFTENSLELCKNIGCPDITINYVKVNGNSEASEKINSEISTAIISALHIEDESEPRAKTIPEAAERFIKSYRMDSADFPDMSAEYFAEINATETYNSKKLVSIQLQLYLYTGGAHGYGNTTFLNFDPQTGAKIALEDLFENLEDFTLIVEEKFRDANNIPKGESINDTGFWFENEVFYLPETIGFTKTDLILLYNQYEIASYADGPITLKIPIQEVTKYLPNK